jgi:hypothetical protein
MLITENIAQMWTALFDLENANYWKHSPDVYSIFYSDLWMLILDKSSLCASKNLHSK